MACSNSEDQWSNYFNYPETTLNNHDSQMMLTTDSVITTSSSMSPSHSSPSTASQKPIRRRSRASKKTPTTLLNADASNFRALVQQFTGRPSPPSMIAPGAQRGPLNINFGQASYSSADDQAGLVSASTYSPLGYNNSYGANPQQHFQYNSYEQNAGTSENYGGDGLNIDDMDWGTISSSTTHYHGQGNNGHHFM